MYGNNLSEAGLIYGKVLREARNLALVSLAMGGEE
jgi:hypothetical protein